MLSILVAVAPLNVWLSGLFSLYPVFVPTEKQILSYAPVFSFKPRLHPLVCCPHDQHRKSYRWIYFQLARWNCSFCPWAFMSALLIIISLPCWGWPVLKFDFRVPWRRGAERNRETRTVVMCFAQAGMPKERWQNTSQKKGQTQPKVHRFGYALKYDGDGGPCGADK